MSESKTKIKTGGIVEIEKDEKEISIRIWLGLDSISIYLPTNKIKEEVKYSLEHGFTTIYYNTKGAKIHVPKYMVEEIANLLGVNRQNDNSN